MEKSHSGGSAAKGDVDALLFCGDAGASRPIAGQSKAFLRIDGLPLFIHTLTALMDSGRVRRIFIIGDKARLERELAESPARMKKPVAVLDQWTSLLENAWNGFLATLDGYETGAEKTNHDFRNRVVFAVAADCPLITAAEIDDFFAAADMSRHDYVAGLTPERVLKQFYPAADRPGIKMAYFHVKEGLFRISNMHMARPFAFAIREPIQKLYNYRYQKKPLNILRLAGELLSFRAARPWIHLYFYMQLAMLLTALGLTGASRRVRERVPIEKVMEAIGSVLGIRAGYAVTERGGAALDIDNERDYIAMKSMFAEWKARLSSR